MVTPAQEVKPRLLRLLNRSQFWSRAGSHAREPAALRLRSGQAWEPPLLRNRDLLILMAIALVVLVGCSGPPSPTPVPTLPPTSPFAFISQESLFASLEYLTAIEPYSGWRNSASQGEAEALEYVEERLGEFDYLQDLGLDLERQSFHVFMGTELWETRLHLTVDGREVEVPADGLRGPRDDIAQALRFDSDGALNDSTRNPVVVEGPVVLVRHAKEIEALSPAGGSAEPAEALKDKVTFVDYAVIDRVLLGEGRAVRVASDLVAKEPAGLVLVTRFSNQPDESHGSFVGDVSALNQVESSPAAPTLYVRLEDLAPAGVANWDDLAQVEAACLTWDADVFSPATSGNLVVRIPGADPSQAVILGAHIDSPNSPGAMDDGSGSAVLLEVARVLDAAQVQPAVDVYLVWFGSEELGLYGSYHFVSTHQELLDRTLAMLQVDCLTRPLDGIDAYFNLVTWSYGRLGDDRLTWPDYLAQTVDPWGVGAYAVNHYGIESDNSAFAGFDVPNANLIYMDFPRMERLGGVHYAGHLHDPYDTVELAREVGDVLEQMARVALAAVLETGQEDPTLRVAPRPDYRALFVASHTEAVHMAPTTFTDLGMALAWEGFDVDLIPYGQAVTSADLEETDLVVVLPVVDYPSPEGDPDLYDEAWSEEEITALEAYVAGGGLLVLTNSAHRLKYNNSAMDPSEDWSDANDLAARFGITYENRTLSSTEAQIEGENPLVEGVEALELAEANGVPFSLTEGQVLAQAEGELAAALVEHGQGGGQVLVLADVGMLGHDEGEPTNLSFWRNLARYARSH